jgi:hypothetical protein
MTSSSARAKGISPSSQEARAAVNECRKRVVGNPAELWHDQYVPTLDSAVAPKDYLGLFDGGTPRFKEVREFLGLKAKEVAEAAWGTVGVPELTERVREWAFLINRVAGFFDSDRGKTLLWFAVSNPLLGGVTPRQMLRLGRFGKLDRIVKQALQETGALSGRGM